MIFTQIARHNPRIKLALFLILLNCQYSCGPIGNVEIIGIEIQYFSKHDIQEDRIIKHINPKVLDSMQYIYLANRVDCINRNSGYIQIKSISKKSGEHIGGCYDRNHINHLIKESLEIYIYSDDNKKIDISDKFSFKNWSITFDENTINNEFTKSRNILISVMTTNGHLLKTEFRFCDL